MKKTSFFLSVMALIVQVGVGEELSPIPLTLPAPAFLKGHIKESRFAEPVSYKPRPAFMAPTGVVNLAKGAKVTSSARNATGQLLAKVVDGNKEGIDEHIVFLSSGTQWTQVELAESAEIYAVVAWLAHNSPKVYHDFIVQVSDDPAFGTGVTTVYNNDQDNSSGQGVGKDLEFFETNEGRLVPVPGIKAKFIRVYTRGSTESSLNERTEIEVFGKPGKPLEDSKTSTTTKNPDSAGAA